MLSNEQKDKVLSAVMLASEQWKQAFNQGDAAGCANQYEEQAVMQARPFGTFKGRQQIEGFWQQLIDDGFAEVDYIEPKFEVIDQHSVKLSSGWKMNKASGVIHKEIWVLQDDGTAKLREDDFEAQG